MDRHPILYALTCMATMGAWCAVMVLAFVLMGEPI